MGLKVDPVLFAPLLSGVYSAWIRTMQVELSGVEPLRQAAAAGKRLAYAVWHDEFFPLVSIRRRLPNERIAVVVSQSRDGELIARVLERWGFGTTRGSSSRGGVRALVGARRLMRDEATDIVFLVDGPRGPRHQAKDGIFILASRAGADIVPIRVRNSRRKTFDRAWDRFQLPWPLSRSEIVFGTPYGVPEVLDEAGLARERAKLENRLATMLDEKDFVR